MKVASVDVVTGQEAAQWHVPSPITGRLFAHACSCGLMMHALACPKVNTRAHAHTVHTHTLTHTHVHTYTRTHVHPYAHAHTHTHEHTHESTGGAAARACRHAGVTSSEGILGQCM